jgi:FkbM family methyltransferase
MTVCHIILPIEGRESPAFDMELHEDIAQDRAVYACLSRNMFPETELVHLLVRAIKPGDFVVDGGACTGFFSLLMASLGATVMAIEPGTNNLSSLYRNIALNNFNIDVCPVALSSKTEMRNLLLIDDGGANSFTQPADRAPGIPSIVNVRRLPDLVQTNPKLIKLDIEGCEFDALEAWLAGPWHCPYIAAEYNLEALDRFGRTGAQMRAMMRQHGYEMFMLFSDGMLPMLVPSNVNVRCPRQNTNVLFASIENVGLLWPELVA